MAQLVKNPPAMWERDLGSNPGLGRSPEEGKGYPVQYSGLENFRDCIVHGVAKNRTQLNDFHFHIIYISFHQAVKANDKSGTILQKFWKNYNVYKTIKNIGFAWCEDTAITILGVWKNLYLQFIHDFCGFEKMDKTSKEVFSNLVTLNDKLEIDLQEDNFTELPAVQHKEVTNEDLLGNGAPEKGQREARGRRSN